MTLTVFANKQCCCSIHEVFTFFKPFKRLEFFYQFFAVLNMNSNDNDCFKSFSRKNYLDFEFKHFHFCLGLLVLIKFVSKKYPHTFKLKKVVYYEKYRSNCE